MTSYFPIKLQDTDQTRKDIARIFGDWAWNAGLEIIVAFDEPVQKIIDEGLRNGGIGAKVCGSGGGGSILFYGDKDKLKKKFKNKVIEFKFDFKGLRFLN